MHHSDMLNWQHEVCPVFHTATRRASKCFLHTMLPWEHRMSCMGSAQQSVIQGCTSEAQMPFTALGSRDTTKGGPCEDCTGSTGRETEGPLTSFRAPAL
jgi:hypothetical protein